MISYYTCKYSSAVSNAFAYDLALAVFPRRSKRSGCSQPASYVQLSRLPSASSWPPSQRLGCHSGTREDHVEPGTTALIPMLSLGYILVAKVIPVSGTAMVTLACLTEHC